MTDGDTITMLVERRCDIHALYRCHDRLGTSLPEDFKHAEKVVKLYALRMKIEEAFQDVKSSRFGLSLELHRTY